MPRNFLFVDDKDKGLLLATDFQKYIYQQLEKEMEPRMEYRSVGPKYWFDDKFYWVSNIPPINHNGFYYTWGRYQNQGFILNIDTNKLRFFITYVYDSKRNESKTEDNTRKDQ